DFFDLVQVLAAEDVRLSGDQSFIISQHVQIYFSSQFQGRHRRPVLPQNFHVMFPYYMKDDRVVPFVRAVIMGVPVRGFKVDFHMAKMIQFAKFDLGFIKIWSFMKIVKAYLLYQNRNFTGGGELVSVKILVLPNQV